MNRKVLGCLLLLFVFSMVILPGCAPPQDPDEPAEAPAEEGDYKEGVFEAVSQGDEGGYVHVTLQIENDEITDAEVMEFNGTGKEKLYEAYPLPQLEDAHNALAEQMIEDNTWEVDTFSGATATSEKAKEAAKFALERASIEPHEQTYFDGTFMAISDVTDPGWAIAWVTMENDEIVDVNLAGTIAKKENGEPVHDEAGRQEYKIRPEDYEWEPYLEARDVMAERFLEAQGPEVDVYTDATRSSEKWMQAVERAMEAARIN